MKLFANCPSCTIEMWGWHHQCAACGAASPPRPAPAASRGPSGTQARRTAIKATILDGKSRELGEHSTRRGVLHVLESISAAGVLGAVGVSALDEPAAATWPARKRRSNRRRREELK